MPFFPIHFLWHIVVATLFIIGAYSLAVGIKARQRSFLYYTTYSYLLLLYLFLRSPYHSQAFAETLHTSRWNIIYWFVQVVYNLVYFYFFIKFLEVERYLPKFSKWLKRFIHVAFFVSVALAVFAFLADRPALFKQYFIYIFSPLVAMAGIIVLIKTFAIPGNLKYFFMIGSATYLTLAVFALTWSVTGKNFQAQSWLTPMVFFYTGIIIEQLAFGLALSYRIQLINEKLIDTLRQHEKIEREMNQTLNIKLREKEKKLLSMTKKAEEKRVADLKNKLENKIHEIQLSSLQSKMNPHFIFNALNSIKVYLIENDKELAIRYMNKFSRLIRKILEGSRVESFTLKEEFDILELYISIENNRFEDDIQFSLPELPPALSGIKVPSLILQPFVENAIWHGLAPSPNPKIISFELTKKAGVWVLSIMDNGVGRDFSRQKHQRKSVKRKSVGLKITHERLNHFNLKYGTRYHFEILDLRGKTGNPKGTEVRFFLDKA